jgi:hypothetical protein
LTFTGCSPTLPPDTLLPSALNKGNKAVSGRFKKKAVRGPGQHRLICHSHAAVIISTNIAGFLLDSSFY